jgi:Amt family ammonium transporter
MAHTVPLKETMNERRTLKVAILLAAFCASGTASAQDGAAVEAASSFSAIDTMWVLMAAFLVFFMQAGFGMVEAGFVRAKNSANVLMKNVLDFCMAALGYFMFGYAIMYGGGNDFIGTSGWFMIGAESGADSIPVEAFWLFQAVFAGAAATIVAGAVAERMRFISYLIYSFIISAFIYPVVGHWVWGGGWLADLDFHDFAGSTVVHTVGGVSALVGAWMLGPRFGRFREDGTPRYIGGHSLPLATIGVFILWFGWYGFNAGSTLGFSEPGVVARVALNTTLAPSMGCIVAMCLAWRLYGKPDLTLALNGALGGLVGITAPCAVVGSGAALAIGGVAGVLVVLCIGWLNRLRIDDVVGAFPVHGLAGIWGTLAVGLFGQTALSAPLDGLFVGGGVKALSIQALGVGVCVAFTAVAMAIVFKLIKMTVGLRVSHETELRGLDRDEHGLDSYAGFQIFHTD